MAKNDINSIEAIDCKFCRRMELEKFCKRIINKERKQEGESRLCYEMSVALVCLSWTKKKGKKQAGRTTDYRHMGLGYKLNYCPECGRYLRSGRKSNE